MKRCNSCNIEINTKDKYCPLCQNILIGKEYEMMFPDNVRYKTGSLVLKIVLFSSIVILLISGFIELLCTSRLRITLIIGLGLITNFIALYYIIKNSSNIYRMIGKYGLIIIILLIIWYIFIRNKVITNYIIPSVCILELIFNFVIGLIFRKNYLIKYSGQMVMNIFLLLLPILLVAFKQTTNNIMSYLCCLFSIISISFLLIFFYEDIKEELHKIFNV